MLNLKKGLAKSVSLEEKTVKFDEVGVLAFGERLGLKELFWKSCAHFVKVLMEYTETFVSFETIVFIIFPLYYLCPLTSLATFMFTFITFFWQPKLLHKYQRYISLLDFSYYMLHKRDTFSS